jgi:DNA-cytosine methyltransferase
LPPTIITETPDASFCSRCKWYGSENARKEAFDKWRQSNWEKITDPSSGDTWWYAVSLASRLGKRLLDPYLDDKVLRYFLQFDHHQLSRPNKPVVRDALSSWFAGFDQFAVNVQLQHGGVGELFANTVLKDRYINRFETVYSSVAHLCQRWGREIATDPEKYRLEVSSFPVRPRASIRTSQFGVFAPYRMADVHACSAQRKFSVLSAFAGGGGSSTGYRLAGGKVYAVIEFVPEAARTYRRNYPETYIEPRDIRDVLRSQSEFFDQMGLQPRELDVLDGSPPCSEFSVAGRGIADQSAKKAYSDVSQNNIASLPFDFVSLAAVLQPKIVVMENVPALATRAPKLFQRIQDKLRFSSRSERLYYVNHVVLTASDFGVPQKRRRLFVIAIRVDVAQAIGIESDDLVRQAFPSSTHFGATVRNALRDLDQPFSAVKPWIAAAVGSPIYDDIQRLPKCPAKLTRISDVDPNDHTSFTLTRCSWALPAPTLVVFGQKPNGMTGALHPEHDRKFTLPELKRLFSLPDDFVLTGTLSQAAERVCRMVPPPMTKAIGDALYEHVLRPYRETQK